MIAKLLSFFGSSKPVVVDCYTADQSVFEYSKIDRAVNFYPDWWREIPKDVDWLTMKGCAGFLDQYKKSFVMPMWSDFNVKLNEDNTFTWRFPNDEMSSATWHEPIEYPNWIHDKSQHIKLMSPWLLHCDEEVYFQILPVQFSKNRLFEWQSVTGVVEYKHQHSTNVNLFLNGNQCSDFSIAFGEPLIFLVPLTERKVVFKYHLVSSEEIKRKQSIFAKVAKNKYLSSKKLKTAQTAACPFSRGKN